MRGVAAVVLGAVVALAPQHATEPTVELHLVPQHPTQVARVAPAASFTVVAANIRAYPVMSRAHYRHDVRRLARIRGRKWVAGSEVQGRAARVWRRVWRVHGYRVVRPYVETSQAVWRGFRVASSRVWLLHRRAPGPRSPARLTVVTRMRIGPYRLTGISLHLTNGCFAGKRARWWYPSRCRALRVEIQRVRRLVARLHAQGRTVLIGGDMNTHRRIVWARPQVSIRPVTLLQIAVVPARGVHASLSRFRVVRRLYSDHNAPVVRVSLRPFLR